MNVCFLCVARYTILPQRVVRLLLGAFVVYALFQFLSLIDTGFSGHGPNTISTTANVLKHCANETTRRIRLRRSWRQTEWSRSSQPPERVRRAHGFARRIWPPISPRTAHRASVAALQRLCQRVPRPEIDVQPVLSMKWHGYEMIRLSSSNG